MRSIDFDLGHVDRTLDFIFNFHSIVIMDIVQPPHPHGTPFLRVLALLAFALLIAVLSSLGAYWYISNQMAQQQTQTPQQVAQNVSTTPSGKCKLYGIDLSKSQGNSKLLNGEVVSMGPAYFSVDAYSQKTSWPYGTYKNIINSAGVKLGDCVSVLSNDNTATISVELQ